MIEFNIKKCNVKLSFWFAVVLSLLCICDKQGVIVCSFVCAVLHEMGHVIAMVYLNVNLKKLHFRAYCVDIVFDDCNIKIDKQILIAFSGVICNFVLFVLFLIAFLIFNFKVLYVFAICNLSLAIFNILPISSLDGGNIFYLFLLKKFESKTAEKLVDIFSCVLLITLSILCFLLMKNFKFNFSLGLVTLYLILNLFFKNFHSNKCFIA